MDKKILKTLLLASTYLCSFFASSQTDDIVVGFGYTHLLLHEDQFEQSSINVSAVGGSLGYQFNLGHFYIMPEIRAAFSVLDATWQSNNVDWTLDLNSYGALGIKFGTQFDYGYLYLSTSLTRIDALPQSAIGEADLDSHDESLGIGGGAAIQMGPWFSVDFGAEYLDMGSIYGGLHLRVHLPVE